MLILEQIQTGGDRNFGYLIGDRKSGCAALIDPSYAPERLIDRAAKQGLTIDYIFCTHGHYDHVNGNEAAQAACHAPVVMHESSAVPHDLSLKDGDPLKIGGISLMAIHVPGHIGDHLVFFSPELNAAFTGDHLFVGKVGGTATVEAAEEQYNSLHKLMQKLPGSATLWPGHDVGCRPSSQVDLEKVSNPFLMVENFEAFLELKRQWAQYKAEQGLV